MHITINPFRKCRRLSLMSPLYDNMTQKYDKKLDIYYESKLLCSHISQLCAWSLKASEADICRRSGVFPTGAPVSRRPCRSLLPDNQHGGFNGKRRLSPPVSFSTLPSSALELQNPWSSLGSEMERSLGQGERIYITCRLRIRFRGAVSLPAQFRSSTKCFGSRQSLSSPRKGGGEPDQVSQGFAKKGEL
jgi:hypothetical protein